MKQQVFNAALRMVSISTFGNWEPASVALVSTLNIWIWFVRQHGSTEKSMSLLCVVPSKIERRAKGIVLIWMSPLSQCDIGEIDCVALHCSQPYAHFIFQKKWVEGLIKFLKLRVIPWCSKMKGAFCCDASTLKLKTFVLWEGTRCGVVPSHLCIMPLSALQLVSL